MDTRHFFQYTLTEAQLLRAVGIMSLVFIISGFTAVVVYAKEKRKMAWIISMVNGFVLTLSAGAYFVVKFPSFMENGRAAFHYVDNVSVLICAWLGLANFFDLAFGLIFYRAYLDPLTAYVHHTTYLWITYTAITGNGGFAKFERFTGGIAVLLIEELPTFLLALGSVFPSMRTDIGFGVTFFSLRILFHGGMLVHSIRSGVSTLAATLFCATMTMHAFWFYSWASKYGAKLLKNNKLKD